MNLKCKAKDMKHGIILNLFKISIIVFLKKGHKISQEMIILISPVGGLYFIGVGMSNQVDVVDVSSGETSRGPSMLHPRQWHATAASPTKLFVFSGVDGGILNSCELSGEAVSSALQFRFLNFWLEFFTNSGAEHSR